MSGVARLLLVEDNADLAHGLRNNLEIDGHAVDTAETGEEALERVRTHPPDLVVLDLMLHPFFIYGRVGPMFDSHCPAVEKRHRAAVGRMRGA